MEKRKMRVNQDHWQMLIDFAEIHPEIVTNKFTNHLQGRQKNKELWEELATKLNSLGQGSRTVEEWKKTLADWKSKTKKKASQNDKDLKATGGGPSVGTPLTTTEERLISLMSRTAVFGDNTVEEIGLKRKRSDPSDHTTQTQEEQVIIIEQDFLEDHDYCPPIDQINIENQDPQSHQQDTESEVVDNPVQNSNNNLFPNKKRKTTEEMHNEIMGVLQEIGNGVSSIASSLRVISSASQHIADSLKK